MAKKSDKSDSIKKDLLAALVKTEGHVGEACKLAGIARSTFYEWRDSDPDFLQAIKDVEESTIDDYERALKRLMDAGNATAIIFFLKTKAKQRGYIEPQHAPNPQGGAVNEANQLPTTFYGHVSFSSTSERPPIENEDELPDA
jgi:hypothetical protein